MSTLKELKKLKLELDNKYYNTGEPTGYTDEQYDALVDLIKEKDPSYNPDIGANVRKEEKRCKIPYHMGSMDKIRPDKPDEIRKLARWVKKHDDPILTSFIVEDKLDGVSCLLVVENGKYTIYKRPGKDGYAADISHLLPYLKDIPKELPDLVVRGELLISKDNYESKYKDVFSNPRCMAAGLTNSKTLKQDELRDLEFVVYEDVLNTASDCHQIQLERMDHKGFRVVNRKVIREIDEKILSYQLQKFKKKSPYEIDGIIVHSNGQYERNTEGNPSYAFAFKYGESGGTVVETTVKKVEWRSSKWDVLKPRIWFEDVNINGSCISKCTGFNAKFIRDNGIGKGAVITITLAGEVIPKIVSVLKPSPNGSDMPKDIDNYSWNNTGVDLVLSGDCSSESEVKQITNFFSKLGIKFMGPSTIKKMYDEGLTSLGSILSATNEDLMKFLGEKTVHRIKTNIDERFKSVSKTELIGASGVLGMGIGRKLVDLIFESVPDMLDLYKQLSREEFVERLEGVDGLSKIRAKNIASNMDDCLLFLEGMEKYTGGKEPKEESKDKKKKLGSKKKPNGEVVYITMSGFRDANIKEMVESAGNIISDSITKKKQPSILIVADKSKETSKMVKARKFGSVIMDKEEFLEKYSNK